LVCDRLQLDLARRPAVAALRAATGRTRLVGRLARRAFGPLVITASPPAVPLGAGTVLDFTVPLTLDQFAGPGWAATLPHGAVTRGSEACLVVPVDEGLGRRGLVVSLELSAFGPAGPIDVVANESRVGRVAVGPEWTTVVARVPGAVAGRFAPLELSLRRASTWPWRFGRLGLRLRRLALHEAADPCVESQAFSAIIR
jgi:hypothetical protein